MVPKGAVAARFLLQSGARQLLKSERVNHCLRTPALSSVDVLHSPEKKRAIYRGLQTCGSVWMCPVCAARVSEYRRKELAAAVAAWKGYGGRILLITYTMRHKASDPLKASVKGLLEARRRLRSGSPARRFNERFGVLGSVRALEVTHGVNGFHPHLHELLFVPSEIDVEALEAQLRSRWSSVLLKAGMRDVNHHGIDVRDTDEAVGEYVAKFGTDPEWKEEHELTKQVVKKGKAGSRAPMGLLEDYCCGDEAAGCLFVEYARAFKGQRQLYWSNGLRDLLIPQLEEKDDEAVVGDTSEYPVLLATLSLEQWRVIVGNDARAEVLEVAGEGDAGKFWEYVASLLAARPVRRYFHQIPDGEEEFDYTVYCPAALLAGEPPPGYQKE